MRVNCQGCQKGEVLLSSFYMLFLVPYSIFLALIIIKNSGTGKATLNLDFSNFLYFIFKKSNFCDGSEKKSRINL
jgi:hypothetical protein